MKDENHYEGYFIYKDIIYGIGTQVIFNDDVYRYIVNAKAKNQPHTFITGSSGGWKGFYWEDDTIPRPKVYSNNISIYNPDKEIKEIIKPVYYTPVSWQKKAIDNIANGIVQPDIFGGVLLYILAMVIGTLFYARFMIWIFVTIVFIIWLLNQYRT